MEGVRVALTVVLFYGSLVGQALSPVRLLPQAVGGLTLIDVNGDPVQPFTNKTSVFLFTRTDCPISNRYAPEIRRIHDRFAPQGVVFRLVYVDSSEPMEAIRKHIQEYGYPPNALLDREHELVKLTGVRTTPEVAVFSAGKLVYRGRIDDRYIEFGKARAAPKTRDLENVVERVTAGKRVGFHQTKAPGCVIEDLREDLK